MKGHLASLRDYLIVSLLAAGTTIGGLSLYLDNRISNASYAIPITLQNQSFRFAMGGGNINDQEIEIQRFKNGLAIVSSGNLTLQAEQFSALRFDIDSLDKLEELVFFARPKHNPNQFIRIPLTPGFAKMLDLRQHPDWQGTISELGVLARSDNNRSYRINSFTLEPATLKNEWQLLIHSWLEFEPWQQRSVNYTTGGAPKQLIHLPSIIIGWFLLSLVFYGLTTQIQKHHFNSAIPIVFLLTGWLILDGRWLINALEQTNHSYSSYAEINAKEKLKQGIDREIITYVEHLKNNVLPDTPSKILLLTDSDSSQYFELKARYHLLPHSAFVSSKLPATEALSQGTYLIVLAGNKEFNYEHAVLVKQDFFSLPANLVDKHKSGILLISN